MKTYDKVYIGTSPICCIDSICSKSANNNVILIDENPTFGGGWTTIKHDNLPLLEIGCHIWSIDYEVFNFISKFLKIQLQRMEPQPILLKNKFVIPYDWKVNIITLKRFIIDIIKLDFESLKKDWINPSFRFSILPSKYLYPKYGTASFINKIKEKLSDYSISYKLNTKVSKIKVVNNKVSLITNDKIISCKTLVITSLSNVSEIEFSDGSILKPSFRKVRYIHIHLLVNEDVGKSFSYVRVIDDQIIHRISDVTSQIKDQISSSRRVIIVGVLEKAFKKYSKSDLLSQVTQKLIYYKFIKSKSKIISYYINTYTSFYNDQDTLKKLKFKSNGRIEHLPSTDLIYSFSKQLKKWRNLLNTSSE